jgi:hypothetical protein
MGAQATLAKALRLPAFWVFGLATSVYGLVASGIGLFNESILAERGFAPEIYYRALAVHGPGGGHGIAGGFVTVVFFSFWGRACGRAHLGRIQWAAQAMTVLASAIGPVFLARWVEATGRYAAAFYALAALVLALGLAAALVPLPAGAEARPAEV